ncbi:FBP domain-containing protein [Streptomyces sp. NPDC047315]|uniref:FBP domain-containing protein n=1 Tax=Streptomyces sp. NPDC047315 TaxID=3155142 RepID=UPI0033F884F6
MEPLSDQQIRASFVNCTKGEAKRLRLPLDFAELPWSDLDYLGWIDPGAPLRAYVVVPQPTGDPLGLGLRVPSTRNSSVFKSSICDFCITSHASSGVTLLAAPLAGARGREGSTVGAYVCADLACSLYVRGKRTPKLRTLRTEEHLPLDEKVARLHRNLTTFITKVTAPA